MRYVVLLGLVVLTGALAGCATVAKTEDENASAMKHIAELDTRQIADDFNLIWLSDRQTRLTRYHTR